MRFGSLAVAVISATAVLAGFGPARDSRGASPTTAPRAPLGSPAGITLGEAVEGPVDLASLPPDFLEPAPEPRVAETIPSPGGYSVDFRHYPTSDEIDAFLAELARDYPDLLAARPIGTSWQGRPIMAAWLAGRQSSASEARPALYLDGQHHAREMISNQVVLYTIWWLLQAYGHDPVVTHLLDTRTVVAVPSVNPDGNDIALHNQQETRRSANPTCCDDDRNDLGTPVPDGRFDEDYSVGFGFGTDEVYRYVFEQSWADAHPDDPFVPGWTEHLIGDRQYAGRFTGALGGPRHQIPRQDMDGDGLTDEDEIGGVDLNRNYDSHWSAGDADSTSETYRGPAPFSEKETAALRDLMDEESRLATALTFHSGADVLLHPWGWSATADLPDAVVYENLSRKGSQLTDVHGLPGAPHAWTARGLYAGSGSAMDYLYESHGVYCWTPEVYGGTFLTRVERLGATGTYSVGVSVGMAFNPPPEAILPTADRWRRWAYYLLAATPALELSSVEIVDGKLAADIANDGILPVSISVAVAGEAGSVLTGEPQTLAASHHTWTFAEADVGSHEFTVNAEATLEVGTVPHVVAAASWRFQRQPPAGPILVEGTMHPFVDVSAPFGGWWAAEHWDLPGRYHLPPGQPIRAGGTVYLPQLLAPLPAPHRQ